VTYKQVRTFQFVAAESNGSLDDIFVLLNIPAATVGATAKRLPKITRGLMNVGLKLIKEPLFVQKTAREILFDGYEDPLLNAAEFIHKFNVPIPGIMDKFGFYYGRNGSDWWDGVFNMFTGSNNLHRLGEIATWCQFCEVLFRPEVFCNHFLQLYGKKCRSKPADSIK
jgi:hypothetical protein